MCTYRLCRLTLTPGSQYQNCLDLEDTQLVPREMEVSCWYGNKLKNENPAHWCQYSEVEPEWGEWMGGWMPGKHWWKRVIPRQHIWNFKARMWSQMCYKCDRQRRQIFTVTSRSNCWKTALGTEMKDAIWRAVVLWKICVLDFLQCNSLRHEVLMIHVNLLLIFFFLKNDRQNGLLC